VIDQFNSLSKPQVFYSITFDQLIIVRVDFDALFLDASAECVRVELSEIDRYVGRLTCLALLEKNFNLVFIGEFGQEKTPVAEGFIRKENVLKILVN